MPRWTPGWVQKGTWTVGAGVSPDYALSMTPGTQTVADGNNTPYTVTVTPCNGFSGVVSFGVSGLPTGVAGSFNPTTGTGSGTSTLTITASGSGVVGSSTALVTGTSGALSHTASTGLTVTPASPSSVSVTPGSGTGLTQTFAFVYTDPLGAADILTTQIVINATLTATSSCYLYYFRASNTIYVASDTAAWQGPLTLGSAGTLQSSQCTLNASGSSASASGNNLTVNLEITFAAADVGAKNVYMEVKNATLDTGWVQKGTWTVGPSGNTPAPVSVTPNNGNTLSQTISFAFSDAGG